MLPITKMISAYNHYKGNNIKYIVLHYTGNSKDTAKNNAIYFNGGDRGSSAHYFCDETSIYQVVEDYNGCWAVGNTKTEVNNKNSISIEMCCSGNSIVSEKTEQNAVELTKYLMKKYNIPVANVRTHAEVTKYGKICPNWQANDWQRWKNFKTKLNESQTSKVEVEKVETKNGEWKVKVLQDTNLWLDTKWKNVGGQVKKDQVIYTTKMTKDGGFLVVDGKYLTTDYHLNYVFDLWKKPIGKIMLKQNCNAWSNSSYDKVSSQVKAWEVFEYVEKRNNMYHVMGVGWISSAFVNKELKLDDVPCTNGCV